MATCTITQVRTLRVGTLNVHQCNDNYAIIQQILTKSNIDILGLQEISRASVSSFASSLGGGYYWIASYGVAILSRFPLEDLNEAPAAEEEEGDRKAVYKKSKRKGGQEGRWCGGVVSVPIQVSQVDGINDRSGANRDEEHVKIERIAVTCVHLDHRLESTRLDEVQSLLSWLSLFDFGGSRANEGGEENGDSSTNIVGKHLWLGDFNALTRSDYSDKDWHRISEMRCLNSWEEPMGDVTSLITSHPLHKQEFPIKNKKSKKSNKKKKIHGKTSNSGGLGFSDVWEVAGVIDRQSGPLGTSRFDTRVDYIYASPGMMGSWNVQSCEHTDTMSLHASDHNLVVATFAIRDTST